MTILNALKGVTGELINMRPRFSIFYIRDCLLGYAKIPPNCVTRPVVGSDFSNKFSIKNGASVTLAASSPNLHGSTSFFSRMQPSSRHLIFFIFKMVTPPQMLGVAASRVVAGMKGNRTGRSMPSVHMQRHMGRNKCERLTVSPETYFAVTPFVAECCPFPTIVNSCDDNLGPKSGLYIFVQKWQIAISHVVSSSRCGQAWALFRAALRPPFLPELAAFRKIRGLK